MSELVRYTVELKRGYTFYLHQDNKKNLSDKIEEVFDVDSIWMDGQPPPAKTGGL
jgi:hypothetical protein